MTTDSRHSAVPVPEPAPAATNLFAVVDMGTNSFKLLIVRAELSTDRFFTLGQLKEPVLLGLDTTSVISPSSMNRALDALRKFQQILHFYHIPCSNCRLVATSAVREASNQSEFVELLHQTLDFHINILSGLDEARFIYLGVLQFFPVLNHTVLAIDIGGGSTEFVVGNNGEVLHSLSLQLGHVTLTQTILETAKMRLHIRNVLESSGLVDKIKEYKIDKVIGSSGTIKAIEKAVCEGYLLNLRENDGVVEVKNRDWKFSKEELKELVGRLEIDGKEKREVFFQQRANFIVAGAILLEEIFEGLGIEEMEVSGYALGEGVISEMLGQVSTGSYDLNVSARWMSVKRLAMMFNNKKRIKSAATCAGIAKEIFEGLRRWNDVNNELLEYLEHENIEYLEAACLLHNVGLHAGKKGYHKQSYHMVVNGNHLQGYNNAEVKLIGLLVKHHRKKFPKCDHHSLDGFTEQVKLKFRMLCAILRVSVVISQSLSTNILSFQFSPSDVDFKLRALEYALYSSYAHLLGQIEQIDFKVLGEARTSPPSPGRAQTLMVERWAELDKELEHFRTVFQKKLSVMVSSSTTSVLRR